MARLESRAIQTAKLVAVSLRETSPGMRDNVRV